MIKITGNEPSTPVEYKLYSYRDINNNYIPESKEMYPGLTIRQEFASRAMQVLLSDPTLTIEYAIKNAVIAADKLIEELNKENK